MFEPKFLLPYVFLLMTSPERGSAAGTECASGEGLICASDGFTYRNKCDLEMAKSIYVGLSEAHRGPCARGYITNPIIQVIDALQQYGDNKVLRKRPSKDSRISKLSRILLYEIVNAQISCLLVFLPQRGACIRSSIRCLYGEKVVCGSDGSTYHNVCDFDIMASMNPHLTVKHQGPCEDQHLHVLNPFVKMFNAVEKYKEGKKGPREQKPDILRIGNLTKMLLAQIIQSQTNLGGINFNNNAINTQGNQNSFGINVGIIPTVDNYLT